MSIFSDDAMRSYHVRELDVFRLMQLREPVDVCISHHWPQHIVRHAIRGGCQATSPSRGRHPDWRIGLSAGDAGPPAFAAALLVCGAPPRQVCAVVNHASGNCTRFLSLSKVLPTTTFCKSSTCLAMAMAALVA